tara:strand:- start:12050 stop:12196 length:147 start_codon:yes stop_codon:yes gene_type:complete
MLCGDVNADVSADKNQYSLSKITTFSYHYHINSRKSESFKILFGIPYD